MLLLRAASKLARVLLGMELRDRASHHPVLSIAYSASRPRGPRLLARITRSTKGPATCYSSAKMHALPDVVITRRHPAARHAGRSNGGWSDRSRDRALVVPGARIDPGRLVLGPRFVVDPPHAIDGKHRVGRPHE